MKKETFTHPTLGEFLIDEIHKDAWKLRNSLLTTNLFFKLAGNEELEAALQKSFFEDDRLGCNTLYTAQYNRAKIALELNEQKVSYRSHSVDELKYSSRIEKFGPIEWTCIYDSGLCFGVKSSTPQEKFDPLYRLLNEAYSEVKEKSVEQLAEEVEACYKVPQEAQ